jgi:hypothetical protein
MPFLAIAGAVVAAAGAAYSGVAQSQAASYQAAVAKINAKQAGYQAEEAESAGRAQQDQLRLRTSALIAQATTAEAANNLQVGTGTPSQVLGDIAKGGAVDVAKSEYNTALTAWGYKSQQTAFENQAKLDTSQASNALISGSLSAAGSLLQGASMYNTNVMGVNAGGGGSSSTSYRVPTGSGGDFAVFGGIRNSAGVF